MSNPDLPVETIVNDPISDQINNKELRFTLPQLENKINLMNKIDSLKNKHNNHHINNNLAKYTSLKSNYDSKIIPSQYHHKENVVNDTTANAYRHHTSSHYVMAGGSQFQKGSRVKGIVSRHSRQAAIRNGKKNKNN